MSHTDPNDRTKGKTMNTATTINCPDTVRGGSNPWIGTLEELVDAAPDKFGTLLTKLEDRGTIARLAEDADDERTLSDVVDFLTLEDVRDLADDPNATVITASPTHAETVALFKDAVFYRQGGADVVKENEFTRVIKTAGLWIVFDVTDGDACPASFNTEAEALAEQSSRTTAFMEDVESYRADDPNAAVQS